MRWAVSSLLVAGLVGCFQAPGPSSSQLGYSAVGGWTPDAGLADAGSAPLPVPDPPQQVTAVAYPDGGAGVSWLPPLETRGPLEGYQVCIEPTPKCVNYPSGALGGAMTLPDSGSFRFAVQAANAAGWSASAWSNRIDVPSPVTLYDLPSNGGWSAMAVADVNGDGQADLLLGSQEGLLAWLGEPGGHLGSQMAVGGPHLGSHPTLVVGDVVGQGGADVIFAQFDTVGFAIHSDAGYLQQSLFGLGLFQAQVATGRFEPNGRLELVSCGQSLQVFRGEVDGQATLVSDMALGQACAGNPIVGDFNEDGLDDVALPDGTVLLNSGAGAFETSVPLLVRKLGPTVVGDFNGDHHVDLLISGVGLLLGLGDGSFQGPAPAEVYLDGDQLVGDFNGDGCSDVLDLTGYYLGLSDGGFSPEQGYPFAGPQYWYPPWAEGDLDHDGKADVVCIPGDRLAVIHGR